MNFTLTLRTIITVKHFTIFVADKSIVGCKQSKPNDVTPPSSRNRVVIGTIL